MMNMMNTIYCYCQYTYYFYYHDSSAKLMHWEKQLQAYWLTYRETQ